MEREISMPTNQIHESQKIQNTLTRLKINRMMLFIYRSFLNNEIPGTGLDLDYIISGCIGLWRKSEVRSS